MQTTPRRRNLFTRYLLGTPGPKGTWLSLGVLRILYFISLAVSLVLPLIWIFMPLFYFGYFGSDSLIELLLYPLFAVVAVVLCRVAYEWACARIVVCQVGYEILDELKKQNQYALARWQRASASNGADEEI